MRKQKFETQSQIEVKGLYTADDVASINLESEVSRPGKFPFTRGVQETMYRGRLWTMRQYAGFGSAKESNERYKLLLSKGQTGLSVAFDLPTQMGYDSDHIMSVGEVGKVGVAISSIEDMELLLKGIPLEKVSTSMTINSTAGILLALYIAVAKKRGVDISKISGTVQNDLLKEYIARGTYIYPPKPSLRIITDVIAFCRKEVPQWNTISISGYHIREAGSTAVQEVAFTLANGLTYVQAALARGLDIDAFAPRLSFFFNVHNGFFEEIAKFRAARRLWAKLIKERFKPKDDRSMMLRFHTQTAGCSLTAQQPENNIVRVTTQALAAVLGGTQSLHTNAMDEALGLPTEKAASIALRTQQILAFESGVSDVVDPLAGSYFVESLTNEIEEKALEYIQKIETLGGVVKCIETGWIQKEIQNSSYKYQLQVEKKEEIIVGVNEFIDKAEKAEKSVFRISNKVAKEQISRLKKFKKSRKLRIVDQHLSKIKNAAQSDDNLMPLFVEAVSDKVTLGEISDALRSVYGVHRETVTV